MSVIARLGTRLPFALRHWVPQLLQGNAMMRNRAIHGMLDTGEPAAATLLCDRLPDADPVNNEVILRGIAALRPKLVRRAGLKIWRLGGKQDKAIAQVALLDAVQRGLERAGCLTTNLPGQAAARASIYRLLADFQSWDWRTSRAAEAKLRVVGDARLLPALFALLGHSHENIVPGVLRLIKYFQPLEHPAAANRLILHGRTSHHRKTGFEALTESGGRWLIHAARVVLAMDKTDAGKSVGIRILADKSFDELRACCVESLRLGRPFGAVEAVRLTGLLAEQLKRLRSETGKRRYRLCLSDLESSLEHAEHFVRHAAVKSLSRLDEPQLLPGALADTHAEVRLAAISALGRAGSYENRVSLLKHLEDESDAVRKATLEVLSRLSCPCDVLREKMLKLLDSDAAAVREMACHWLAEHGVWWDAPRLRKRRNDTEQTVRDAARQAVQKLSTRDPRHRHKLRRRLKHKDAEQRRRALVLLAEIGDPGDTDAMLALANDPDEGVRRQVLHVVHTMSRQRQISIGRQLLIDDKRAVVRGALSVLAPVTSKATLTEWVMSALRRAKGIGAVTLMEYMERQSPAQLPGAIGRAIKAKDPMLRGYAAGKFAGFYPGEAVTVLKGLLKDRDAYVRATAFKQLAQHAPGCALRHLRHILKDASPELRCLGLDLVCEHGRRAELEQALTLVRDPHHLVRAAALRTIAKLDDPRVIGEVISAMNDTNRHVAETARDVCYGPKSHLPAMGSLSRPERESVAAQRLTLIRHVHDWATIVGRELLGRPIAVKRLLNGLGCTTPPKRRDGPVPIYINDLPVAGGHRHGIQVMRALCLHELGHHVYDIGVRASRTCRGRARAMGVGNLYDILSDERLERGLRSRRPPWGVCFDRLASYAFAQRDNTVSLREYAGALNMTTGATRLAVKRREAPGRLAADGSVLLGDADLLKLPGMLPRLTAFLVCLRCGFDPRSHPDPVVAEAIRRVPANLKDLDNRQLLDAATSVGALIGHDKDYRRQVALLRKRLRLGDRLRRMLEKWIREQPDHYHRQDAPDPEPGPRRRHRTPALGMGVRLNRKPDTSFEPLRHRKTLTFDHDAHARLVETVAQHVPRLRRYFQRLGRKRVDHYGSKRGHRIDPASVGRSVVTGGSNLLVQGEEITAPDAYLGLLIDRSGSMRGDGIELARCFGTLLIESARGLRGIEGHVGAFDDKSYFELGDLQFNAIASLGAGQGNNDAGGMAIAAEKARTSRKRNRLLVMVSDGSPTECSVAALSTLVKDLVREGMVCAQVAVKPIEHDCFANYVDVSQGTMDEAVDAFGRMLMRLTATWR